MLTLPDEGAAQPTLQPPDLARYRQLTAQLAQRERLPGHAVRWQQPDWARTILGPLPTSRRAEANWIDAASAIAAYRERWEVAGRSCPRPSAGIQELDWVALRKKFARLQPATSRPAAATAPAYQPRP